jgi:hypothetical protein
MYLERGCLNSKFWEKNSCPKKRREKTFLEIEFIS